MNRPWKKTKKRVGERHFLILLSCLLSILLVTYRSAANAADSNCSDTRVDCLHDAVAREILAELSKFLSDLKPNSKQSSTSSDQLGHAAGVEFTYLSYRDTDGDVVLRSSSATTAWVGNVRLIEHGDKVTATDYQGSQWAETRSIEAIANLTESVQVNGAIGSILTDLRRQDFTGSIRADFSHFGGKLSASVSRGMLTWGATTIRNHIMTTDVEAYAYRNLIGKLAMSASLKHREFSDHNSSNSTQLAPEYGFNLLKTHVTFGYRFSYATFARQTYSGYSAPKLSVSHNAYSDFYYDSGRFYNWLELSGGYGSSRMTTTTWGDFYGGSSANIGLRLTKKLLVELNLYGNNSGLSNLTEAWSDFSTGLKVKYTF
jgi:hypothetical protein